MKNNVLRYAVDIKGETIIASMHKFSGHQGNLRSYNKIRGTFFWNGMKNDKRTYLGVPPPPPS